MAFPNLSAPFLLYTDASLHSVGSVLSQQVEGKEHVIAYASHVLSASERKLVYFSIENCMPLCGLFATFATILLVTRSL